MTATPPTATGAQRSYPRKRATEKGGLNTKIATPRLRGSPKHGVSIPFDRWVIGDSACEATFYWIDRMAVTCGGASPTPGWINHQNPLRIDETLEKKKRRGGGPAGRGEVATRCPSLAVHCHPFSELPLKEEGGRVERPGCLKSRAV